MNELNNAKSFSKVNKQSISCHKSPQHFMNSRFIAVLPAACYWTLLPGIYTDPDKYHNILWFISLFFSHPNPGLPSGPFPSPQHFLTISHPSNRQKIVCTSYTPWLNLPNILWRGPIMNLLIIQFSPFSCYFLPTPLCPNTPCSTLSLKTVSLCSSPNMGNQVLHLHKTSQLYIYVNGKGKGVPVKFHAGTGSGRGKALLILQIGVKGRFVVSVRPQPLYTQERAPEPAALKFCIFK